MKSEKEKEKGGKEKWNSLVSFRVIFLKVKSPSSGACFELAESLERLMILSGVPSILSHFSPVENDVFWICLVNFLSWSFTNQTIHALFHQLRLIFSFLIFCYEVSKVILTCAVSWLGRGSDDSPLPCDKQTWKCSEANSKCIKCFK